MCHKEHKHEKCGCMNIYHLMDDGNACLDKEIMRRLEELNANDREVSKPCECENEKGGRHEIKITGNSEVDCKNAYKMNCAPEPKPSYKPSNPEYRCECYDASKKPDTSWCYPHTSL